jgi:energy-coupling factor transport system permease protein
LGAAFGFPSAWWSLAFFGLVMLPLAARAGLLRPFLINVTRLIFPFLLSLFFIQGFFTRGETVWFMLGPFGYSREGFEVAFDFSMRILQAIASITLFLFVTRPDHLMQALNERGLPHEVSYLVVTTLQIIPRFQNRAEAILEAQQARGLETDVGPLRKLGLLIPLITPLVLGSIIDIDERAVALETRAFSAIGERTNLHHLNTQSWERGMRRGLVTVSLMLIAWRIYEATR